MTKKKVGGRVKSTLFHRPPRPLLTEILEEKKSGISIRSSFEPNNLYLLEFALDHEPSSDSR